MKRDLSHLEKEEETYKEKTRPHELTFIFSCHSISWLYYESQKLEDLFRLAHKILAKVAHDHSLLLHLSCKSYIQGSTTFYLFLSFKKKRSYILGGM